MAETPDTRGEIERISRVADMLVTAHSTLSDRYARWAFFLDAAILGLSVWLTSVVFVEPKIGVTLTPFHLEPQIWIGLLSIFTLFLSVVQLRVDWKGRSDAHRRSADMYSVVKSESRRSLQSGATLTGDQARELFTKYDLSANLGCEVPEAQFLKMKRMHLIKVAISKHLDTHPAASILMLRARLWWKSNRQSLNE
jgi:hypothetical protein